MFKYKSTKTSLSVSKERESRGCKFFRSAVILNLRFFEHFAKVYGFRIKVEGGDLEEIRKPLSGDESTWARMHWTVIYTALLLRTAVVLGTLALALLVDRFFDPVFFPAHVLFGIGTAVVLPAHHILGEYRNEFMLVWNFIWVNRRSVVGFKVQHVFIYLATASLYLMVATGNLVLAHNPHWAAQCRFLVHWACAEGILDTDGAVSMCLAVIAVVVDFTSLFFMAAVGGTLFATHLAFLEVWSNTVDRLDERRKPFGGNTEGTWRRLQELVVALRVFNIGNAGAIFVIKLQFFSTSILCLSTLLLAKLDHFFVRMLMIYLSLLAPFGYPVVYSQAPAVGTKLEEFQRRLRLSDCGSKLVQRRVWSMSVKGVWVGGFHVFERESMIIFLDFIIKQVTSIVLTWK